MLVHAHPARTRLGSHATRRACALLALCLASAVAAHAQSKDKEKPNAPKALTYRSSFEQYKPYTTPPAPTWRAANDEVGRIGGWRAYAREADAPAPAPTRAPAPASAPAGASTPTATPSPAAPKAVTPQPGAPR